jgi:deoxyribonuclease-1
MKIILSTLLIFLALYTFSSIASNQSIQSFNKAKKLLEKQVYHNHRKTLYCSASFNPKKKIVVPKGFTTNKYRKRAKKIEWEHIVPAENFGRNFKAWRIGDDKCVNSKGKSFKGRRCAEKIDKSYRYLQADMFNLYPAIGAVNALRSNYNFTMLPNIQSSFGSCKMKIDNTKAEPPEVARGRISRTYLYMDTTYKQYSMSRQQKRLMLAWDKIYPVDQWECSRAKKITHLQQNDNPIVMSRCKANNLW